MRVQCDECGASTDVDRVQTPPGGEQGKCRSCGASTEVPAHMVSGEDETGDFDEIELPIGLEYPPKADDRKPQPGGSASSKSRVAGLSAGRSLDDVVASFSLPESYRKRSGASPTAEGSTDSAPADSPASAPESSLDSTSIRRSVAVSLLTGREMTSDRAADSEVDPPAAVLPEPDDGELFTSVQSQGLPTTRPRQSKGADLIRGVPSSGSASDESAGEMQQPALRPVPGVDGVFASVAGPSNAPNAKSRSRPSSPAIKREAHTDPIHVEVRHDEVVRRLDAASMRGVRIGDPSSREAEPPSEKPDSVSEHECKQQPISALSAPISTEKAGANSGRTSQTQPSDEPEARTDVEESSSGEQPSVIVDMRSIGDEGGPPQEIGESDDSGASEAPPTRAAEFASPLVLSPAEMETGGPPSVDGSESGGLIDADVDDLRAVRGPRAGRTVAVLTALALVGSVGFVTWRVGWGELVDDPTRAVKIAVGIEKPPATQTPEPTIEIQENLDPVGALEIENVALEMLSQRSNAALLTGTLVNRSSHPQAAITIEATLIQGGLPVKQRVVACCKQLGAAQALEIAKDPKHTHFRERFNDLSKVRVEPLERRSFSVVFRDVETGKTIEELVPVASVKYAEVVRDP